MRRAFGYDYRSLEILDNVLYKYFDGYLVHLNQFFLTYQVEHMIFG